MATITGNVSWSIYIVPQDFFLVSLRVLSLSIYLYHFFSKTIQQGADPDIFQGGGGVKVKFGGMKYMCA